MFENIKNYRSLNVLEEVFLGNTILEYLFFLGLLLSLFLIIKVTERLLLGKLKKLKKSADNKNFKKILFDFLLSIKSYFYLYLAFFISLSVLTIPENFKKVFVVVLVSWAVFRLMIGIQMVIDYLLDKKLLKDAEPGKEVMVKNLGTIAKVIMWIFAFLLVLSNFGVEVTSLIAGLGVGGIAIAFAFQSILEDLFSSFAIYIDKPFTVGDFIIVGDQIGIVEKIGIKTTRVRALQGEEIVISNTELTTEIVHNFKKLEKRRGVFNFGVVYGTSDEKMRKIPEIVEEIISSKDLTEFDRAHFKEFGDSALEFEVAYYVLSSKFMDYRDTHQKILFDIKERFNNEGIEMAFPTRTVHLSKN